MDQSMTYYEEGERISKKSKNPFRDGEVYRIAAAMAFIKKDYRAAENALHQAIDIFTEINDQRFLLVTKSDLAHFYRRTDQWDKAISLYQETLSKWQEHGNIPALAHQLECFAFIAIYQGNFEHAARLLGKAREMRKGVHAESTNAVEIAELRQALEQLNEALGESERERLMRAGEGLSMDEAVASALAEIEPVPVMQ